MKFKTNNRRNSTCLKKKSNVVDLEKQEILKWAHKIRSLQEPPTRNISCLNV